MSKSNSLNQSNSTEIEHDPDMGNVKDPSGSLILEDGNESVTTEEDGYNADVSSSNSNSNYSNTRNDPNCNKGGGGAKVIRSSPPPSYEFVLEENRLKQQESVNAEAPVALPQAPLKIIHKSSKEFYKAVAKQFGITCKMSDHCRCYDCQSHYFDCEYEQNEQEKTDGGLGAGTPVFLNEMMHASSCSIL